MLHRYFHSEYDYNKYKWWLLIQLTSVPFMLDTELDIWCTYNIHVTHSMIFTLQAVNLQFGKIIPFYYQSVLLISTVA